MAREIAPPLERFPHDGLTAPNGSSAALGKQAVPRIAVSAEAQRAVATGVVKNALCGGLIKFDEFGEQGRACFKCAKPELTPAVSASAHWIAEKQPFAI